MYHIHRLLAPIRSNSVFSLAQLPKPSLIGCRYKSNNVGSQDRTLKTRSFTIWAHIPTVLNLKF